ncbi:MAG: radical SAM protein [Deltaproteobacteria bacterium]|nr:radical SAM protein [Deltaproteobacteria bacterium]
METGGDLAQVNGLTFRRDGAAISTSPRDFIEDLDALPWPAWDLVDIEGYAARPCMSTLPKRRYMTLFTSRACPYRCNYCHDVFGKVFRARSPENVVAEIEEISRRYGITEFECVDDIVNIDNRRAERICDLSIERGLEIGITFPNGLRADRLPRALLEKLRRAGTRTISFAVESASERIQKETQKKMNLQRLAQAVRDANELGILCTGFFMLGFPGETREELQSTVNFALSIPLHTAHFFIVTPFQGTPLSERYSSEVRRHAGSFETFHYILGSTNLSAVSDQELYRIQRTAWLRFYLQPRRMWQLLRSYPEKRGLLVKAARLLGHKVVRNRRRPDALLRLSLAST